MVKKKLLRSSMDSLPVSTMIFVDCQYCVG